LSWNVRKKLAARLHLLLRLGNGAPEKRRFSPYILDSFSRLFPGEVALIVVHGDS
jgi:hypothetical protein